MPRDPILRMDLATDWPWGRRVRALRSKHPQLWPTYWAAYLALLAEVWRSADPELTLRQTWLGDLPGNVDEAGEALREVGLIDEDDKVPSAAWLEWIAPATIRVFNRRAAGQAGGRARAAAVASADGTAVAATHATPSLAKPSQANAGAREDNESGSQVFMGFRPKTPKVGSHEGQHPNCIVCKAGQAKGGDK